MRHFRHTDANIGTRQFRTEVPEVIIAQQHTSSVDIRKF
jgi:hypothetical protein